jgi:hypothetical protein
MRLFAAVSILLGASAAGAQERDATRLEVGERYCFADEACLAAVRRDVAEDRPIQWVIFTLGQVHYDGSPENAERAYDAAVRAMTYANDFLSDAEFRAGQKEYGGGNAAALRQILDRYTVACENKRWWMMKHRCLMRAKSILIMK